MQSRPVLLAIGPLPPPISGLTKAFEFVVRGLPGYGWDVRTVNIADPTFGRPAGSFSLVRARGVASALFSAASRLPFADVVYLTISQSRLGFAKDAVLLRIASLLGRRVVVHMHGGNFGNFYRALTRLERRLIRGTLDGLSRIIVLTESLKADFSMTRDWSRRTVAVSNMCDTSIGLPRALAGDGLRVLYLSNLTLQKGYRDLILAMGLLSSRRPELRLRLDLAGAFAPERDFADQNAQAADLERLIADLPRQVTTEYHGVVQGEGKARLLREADVFVLPTWYVNEGQPIAVLEALTAGLPVIATDWRGIRESLPPSLRELLVSPRSPDAIAARLQALVDDPARFQAMSRAALDHAGNYRPERHLAAIDGVLRGALAEELR